MKTKIVFVTLFTLFVMTSVLPAETKLSMSFPPVALEPGYRIIGLDVQFRSSVYVRKISKIPKDWEIQVKLDPPPFPKISGNCVHGAGALMSTRELPEFEIEPFEIPAEQIMADATLYVVEFSGQEKVKEIKITLKGTGA